MDTDESWAVIAAERRTLADLLDALTAAEWERPSLCVGWRVRDVAAHLAMVPVPPAPAAMFRQGVRARGSFHRLNHDLAVRAGQRPTADITAEVREHADSRRVPVVTNYRNVLFDILVHGQDIARPLGIDRPMPLEAARSGADRVWTMGWPFWSKRRLKGLRLVATDVDWAVGEGPVAAGPIGGLLLVLTGRPAGVGDLEGEAVGALRARLGAPQPAA